MARFRKHLCWAVAVIVILALVLAGCQNDKEIQQGQKGLGMEAKIGLKGLFVKEGLK